MGIISSVEKIEKLAEQRGFKFGGRDARIRFIHHIKGIIKNPCECECCEECEFCEEDNCKTAMALKWIEKFIDDEFEKLDEDDKKKMKWIE